MPLPHPKSVAELGVIIRQAREAAGLTLDAVARATGISKPYLSNIETGRAPGPASAEKLAQLEALLQFTPGALTHAAAWLRTPPAIQAMLIGSPDAPPPRREDGAIDLDKLLPAKKLETATAQETPGAVRAVPLINRVAAGAAREYTDLGYPVGYADAYVPVAEEPGRELTRGLFAVCVEGDSMEPAYHAGEIVIVGPGEVQGGEDCLVRLGERDNYAQTLKRVEFIEDGQTAEAGGSVRLVPLNSAHPIRVVALAEITGMYPVRWKLTPVRPGR